MRVESGPMKGSPDDWTGIFLRGDDALGLAACIRAIVEGDRSVTPRLADYVRLLERCREDGKR
jgi:hypothetical protein